MRTRMIAVMAALACAGALRAADETGKAATTQPAEQAQAWIERGVKYARDIEEKRKRQSSLSLAASLYVGIGREPDGRALLADLTPAQQQYFEATAVHMRFRGDPDPGLKAVAAMPDIDARTDAYILFRVDFVRGGNIELLRRTLGEDQKPLARSRGYGKLADLLARQEKFTEANAAADQMADADSRESEIRKIWVAKAVAAGEKDLANAAAKEKIVPADLDRALHEVAEFRVDAGDIAGAEKLCGTIQDAGSKAMTWMRIAIGYRDAGDNAKAEAALVKAEKLVPQIEPMYAPMSLAAILRLRVDWGEGEKVIAWIRARPKEEGSYAAILMYALVELGKPDEAVKAAAADDVREILNWSLAPQLARRGYYKQIDGLVESAATADERATICLMTAETILEMTEEARLKGK